MIVQTTEKLAMIIVMWVVLLSQLIFPNQLASPLIVLVGLAVILFTAGREEHRFLKIGWPLVAILLVGLMGSYSHDSRHVLRDVVFSFYPIVLTYVGYWMAGNKDMSSSIFRVLMISVFASACYHLYAFIESPELLFSGVEEVREQAGKGTQGMVVVGLALAMFQSRLRLGRIFPKILPMFIALPVLLASFVLSFSRTEFLMFLVIITALSGWITKIQLSKLLGVTVLLTMCITVVMTTPDDETGTLRSKLARSVTEISATSFVDDADINTNWRAFETSRVMDSYSSSSAYEQAFGQGFGALVDIGFEMKLGDDFLRAIPTFHNGYAYILIKTGIIGIIFYALYFYQLIRFAVRYVNSRNDELIFLSRLLLGSVLSMMLMMFVIGGMAETAGPVLVLLIGYLVHRIENLEKHINKLPGELAQSVGSRTDRIGRLNSRTINRVVR